MLRIVNAFRTPEWAEALGCQPATIFVGGCPWLQKEAIEARHVVEPSFLLGLPSFHSLKSNRCLQRERPCNFLVAWQSPATQVSKPQSLNAFKPQPVLGLCRLRLHGPLDALKKHVSSRYISKLLGKGPRKHPQPRMSPADPLTPAPEAVSLPDAVPAGASCRQGKFAFCVPSVGVVLRICRANPWTDGKSVGDAPQTSFYLIDNELVLKLVLHSCGGVHTTG